MGKSLRVVAPDERKPEPPTLMEAVESGDVLEILKAQRRIVAASLESSSENTKPQFSNELSKLTDRITEEEARRVAAAKEADVDHGSTEAEAWDQEAI